MAGEVVEAREPLELRLMLLARADEAQRADETGRLAVGAELHLAAVMHPAFLAARPHEAVLGVVRAGAREMVGERLPALRKIFGVDIGRKPGAGIRHLRRVGIEERAREAHPGEAIGREIPVVNEVAGRFDRVTDPT